jgi:hypothetical protein
MALFSPQKKMFHKLALLHRQVRVYKPILLYPTDGDNLHTQTCSKKMAAKQVIFFRTEHSRKGSKAFPSTTSTTTLFLI